MRRQPPRTTRTDTLFPSPTLFRSVKRRNSLAVGVDELRNVVLMDHRIIRRDADLSAVLKLAVGDAFGGTLKGRSLFDERRVFSPRSEEHTSEHQSLMRISYAVFCWKKKKTRI